MTIAATFGVYVMLSIVIILIVVTVRSVLIRESYNHRNTGNLVCDQVVVVESGID